MKKTVFYLIALIGFMYTTGCGSTRYRTSGNYQSGYGERVNYGQSGSGKKVSYGNRYVAQPPQQRYVFATPSDSGVSVSNTIPVKPYVEPVFDYRQHTQHVYSRPIGYSQYTSEVIRKCVCGKTFPNDPVRQFSTAPINYRYAPGR